MAGWESPLQVGDALAVEKMILAQDVGTVSFEQNVIVRSDGQELLTTSPARPWL
jgi:Xaa-Pro aminopeptidase